MANLVLIPGMMCDASLYGPQITLFSKTHNVFVANATRHQSMEEMAADLLGNAPSQFALAGLSMGGILAMEVFRQAPDRILKLALLDTNPRAELDQVKAIRGPQMEAARRGKLEDVMRTVIPKYGSTGENKDELDALCLKTALDLGPDIFINQSIALRDRPDQQETLRQVSVPTLVLCGEEDQLCPVERHTRMKELIPHADLEILKKIGHLPTLQAPEQTNIALKKWLG